MARLVEDAELEWLLKAPAYGGHPAKLSQPAALEQAKDLLRAGKPPIVVANELGYAHDSTFSAAFRREVGVPPGRWQAEQGVEPKPRKGGRRALRKRKIPDRTGQVPLPRYSTRALRKKKAEARRRKKAHGSWWI